MSRKSYSKTIVPFPTRLMFDISGRTRYSRVWQTGRLLAEGLNGGLYRDCEYEKNISSKGAAKGKVWLSSKLKIRLRGSWRSMD